MTRLELAASTTPTIAEGEPQKQEHNDIQWITPSEIPNYAFCPADEEILAKLSNDGLSKDKDDFDIKRSKGLGENQPDMMSLTTMHPATRRLIRVTPENAERTSMMFDILLGDNLVSRKQYISDNGSQYMEMLDLS